MAVNESKLPFQALTLRERVIAELSFPLLDKGTDAVTIGDVRQIADRIVALIAEQSDSDATSEEIAKADPRPFGSEEHGYFHAGVRWREALRRIPEQALPSAPKAERCTYPPCQELPPGAKHRCSKGEFGWHIPAEDEPKDVILRHRCRVLLSTMREPSATESERESILNLIAEIVE